MKTLVLVVAALALTVLIPEPAAATCYIHRHEVDPVKQETGTVVDRVVVYYDHAHCDPIPP